MKRNKSAGKPNPPPAPVASKPSSQRTIAILFGLSGTSALIYEVVWSRSLQFIFGSSTHTVATILAGLLIGFSLGSFLFSNLAQNTKSPLKHFALIEIGIGIYGLAMPLMISLAKGIYLQMPDVLIFQLALCMLILLIPATLFGGLWPYVGRLCLSESDDTGSDAAIVYSGNSFGSAFGAFLGGFILIPILGLGLSSLVASFLNLGIGAVAFDLLRKGPSEK